MVKVFGYVINSVNIPLQSSLGIFFSTRPLNEPLLSCSMQPSAPLTGTAAAPVTSYSLLQPLYKGDLLFPSFLSYVHG